MIKKYRIIEIGLLVLIFLFAWNLFRGKGIEVQGSFPDFPSKDVVFSQSFFDNSFKTIFSAKTDEGGQFSFKYDVPLEPGLYQCRVGGKWVYFTLSGEEKKIEIKARLEDIENYTFRVLGSETATEYVSVLRQSMTNKISPNALLLDMEQKIHPITASYLAINLPSLKFLVTPQTISRLSERMDGKMSDSPYRNFLKTYTPASGFDIPDKSSTSGEVKFKIE